MEYPPKNNIPYDEIQNGALILLLLRESKTWEQLCRRYEYADPCDLGNTNTMTLRDKLVEMRDLDLISFDDEETERGKKPIGEIKETGLWSKIRVAFGGMSLREAATISRHSKGMAIAPVFGRPQQHSAERKIDVFVLMPFSEELKLVWKDHIRKVVSALNLNAKRADDFFTSHAVMGDIWGAICEAKVIIADCTGRNPNVFYEIGIAHTIGKPVVLTTQNREDVPFDLRHLRYIEYKYTPPGMQKFEEDLNLTLTETLA